MRFASPLAGSESLNEIETREQEFGVRRYVIVLASAWFGTLLVCVGWGGLCFWPYHGGERLLSLALFATCPALLTVAIGGGCQAIRRKEWVKMVGCVSAAVSAMFCSFIWFLAAFERAAAC